MIRETQHTLPIIVALIVAIAPHTPGLPLWINLWCLIFWGYLLLRLKTGWPLPSAPVRYALVFFGILGMLVTFRAGIGGDAFVGLLSLMAAIKPFEMPTHRHRMITILLTYFIIITSLFRSDSLFIILYMVFSVFITTMALVRINAPDAPLKKSAGLALKIQALALPLAILLFLAFPRLPGSLVGLDDPGTGKTGLSEQLSPGSISRLIQDQTPAFRADFDGEIPKADHLYWRSIVFSAFDGRTWKPAAREAFAPQATVPATGSVTYTILLPPHAGQRLPALDRPVKGPAWSRLSADHSLSSLRKIRQKTTYQATSILPDPGGPPTGNQQIKTEKPVVRISGQAANPRAAGLAVRLQDSLAKEAVTPEGKARAILSHFTANGFSYSLTPRVLNGPPLDTFLFDTRTGFCEHYASAFAFLMNAMGVPARVVGGYLGGELNPYGNYLIVRQAYAHAWAEYWAEGRGWVRIDPTLAVRPDRLTIHPDGSAARAGKTALSMLRRTGLVLDAVNLKWETWFTGYSLAEQMTWLKKIGMEKAPVGYTLIFITLICLLGFLGLLGLGFFRKRKGEDPVAAAYGLFLKKMTGAGFCPQPGDGPRTLAISCAAKRPDLEKEVQSIVDLYIELRYKKQSRATVRDLTQRVGAFRPGRKHP